MLVYPENKYKIEIIDNSQVDEFVLVFKEKPEDLVFHLLRAVGFVDRSFGKEFVHPYDAEIRIFADQLQKSLAQGCFPKSIPYESPFEQSEESIDNYDFSIAGLKYHDSKGSTQDYEFLIFERNKSRRTSLAYVLAILKHGDNLREVSTTYRIGKKRALKLFNMGEFVVKLPEPFGAGCPPFFDEKIQSPAKEITSTITLSEVDFEKENTTLDSDGEYHGLNHGSNDGIPHEKLPKDSSTLPLDSEENPHGENDGSNQGLNHRINQRNNDGFYQSVEDELTTQKHFKMLKPISPFSKERYSTSEDQKNLISIKEIILSENPIQDDQKEDQLFPNWQTANRKVQDLVGQFSNVYYQIYWTDGFEIKGRMDLEPASDFMEVPDLFSKHLANFYYNIASSEANAILSQDSIAIAQKLLRNYSLIDAVEQENSPIQKEITPIEKENPVDEDVNSSDPKWKFKPDPNVPIVQPYSKLFQKLYRVIPNLIEHLKAGKYYGRSKVKGYMDLVFEFLYQDQDDRMVISLSHYFTQEGDLVADPDMEVSIDPILLTAEALTYQDQLGFQRVYQEEDGLTKINSAHKKKLNRFLGQWLKNLIDQGHLIDLSIEYKNESESKAENEIIEQEDEEVTAAKSPASTSELFDFYESEIIAALKEKNKEKAFEILGHLELIIRDDFKPDFLKRLLVLIGKTGIKGKLRLEDYTMQAFLLEQAVSSNLKQNIWNLLPQEKKSPATPKVVTFDSYPHDPGLQNIIRNFPEEAQSNNYRGVLFDEYGIMATDTICLLFISRPTEGKFGYYCMTRRCWESQGYSWTEAKENQKKLHQKKQGILSPNQLKYDSQLREKHRSIVAVDGVSFYQKLQLIQKYTLYYKGGGIFLKFKKHFLKLDLFKLLKIIKAMLQLGHTKLDFCYQAKKLNLTIVPKGKAENVSSYQTDFALLMPMLFESDPQNGSLYFDTLSDTFKTIGIEAESNKKTVEDTEAKSASALIPIQSIVISEAIMQEERLENLFDNWIKADFFFQKLFPRLKENEDSFFLSVLWKNGMELNRLKIDAHLPYLHYYPKAILGGVAASLLLHQIHLQEGRIPGKKQVKSNDLLELFKSMSSLDFGGLTDFMTHKLKPKIPVQTIEVKSGSAKRLNAHHFQLWEKFTQASQKIETAGALMEKEQAIEITIRWIDGRELQDKLSPIQIPSKVKPDFWVKWLAEKLGKDAILYQRCDQDALLEESELSSSLKLVLYEKLLSATFKNRDDKSTAILIDGITYQGERLIELLLKQLFSLPQIRWKDLIEEYSNKFKLTDELGFISDSKAKSPAAKDRLEVKSREAVYDSLSLDKQAESVVKERLSFLIHQLGNADYQVVDIPINEENTTTKLLKSSNPSTKDRIKLNQEIEGFIDERKKDKRDLTLEELNWINQYSGYGGIHTNSPNTGSLYEYYTPPSIIEKMWDLAYHFNYQGGDVLEPAVGSGRFLEYAPQNSRIVAYEVNPYASFICQKTYPNAIVYNQPFESLFFEGNRHLKNQFSVDPFQLVIGNPPYGEFKGKYAGMGERKFTHASEYDQYFISRGLDVLSSGGLLVFLISSYFLNSKKAYQKVKRAIASKAELIHALRLPNGSVPYTEVGTDIILFKKR